MVGQEFFITVFVFTLANYIEQKSKGNKKMVCEEKSCDFCDIATYEKIILGVPTSYRLKRIYQSAYEISIRRRDIEKRVIFKGELFDIFDLFRCMVVSDTLPENMDDIAEDFYSIV